MAYMDRIVTTLSLGCMTRISELFWRAAAEEVRDLIRKFSLVFGTFSSFIQFLVPCTKFLHEVTLILTILELRLEKPILGRNYTS